MVASARVPGRSNGWREGALLVLSAGLAGGLTAALTNLVASVVTFMGVLVAACLVAVAVLGRFDLPQFNRETPRAWLRIGGLRSAALHGGTLGAGVFTRIKFWLFYTYLLSVTLVSLDVALAIGALYGVSRTGMSLLLRQHYARTPVLAGARNTRLVPRVDFALTLGSCSALAIFLVQFQ